MRRRIATAAGMFAVATVATVVLAHYFPPPLEGPAVALVLAALGALFIGLAPSEAPAAAELPRTATPAPLREHPSIHERVTPLRIPAIRVQLAVEPDIVQPESA